MDSDTEADVWVMLDDPLVLEVRDREREVEKEGDPNDLDFEADGDRVLLIVGPLRDNEMDCDSVDDAE